jgi:hypothetical protein
MDRDESKRIENKLKTTSWILMGPKMDRDESAWIQMDLDGSKWFYMGLDVPKYIEMNLDEPK